MGTSVIGDFQRGTWPAERDPQQLKQGSAFVNYLRNPPPGWWTDDRFEQSRHFTGCIFVAIAAVMDAMGSATACLERKESKPKRTTFLGDRAVKSAPIPHGESDDEEYAPVPDHPVLSKLLRRPNPTETFGDFLSYMALQACLTGSAPVWAIPNASGKPVELYPLNTALLQPQSQGADARYPNGSWRVQPYYTSGTGWAHGRVVGTTTLPAEEVKRLFYRPHPLTRLDGYSPLSACGVQLDILEAIDLSRHSAFEQGTQFGDVLIVPGLDPKVAEQLGKDMSAKKGGARHAREFTVISPPPGLDAAKFMLEHRGDTAREMDYQSSWDQAVKFLLAIFGVPPSVAGLAGATSYAELFAALRQFYHRQQTLVKRFGDFFTTHLCGVEDGWSRREGEYRIRLTLAKLEDPELEEKRLALDLQNGLIDFNEARKLRGRAPKPGGDIPAPIYLAQQQQAIAPQPQPGMDDNPLAEMMGRVDEPTDTPTGGAPPQPANPQGQGTRPPRGPVAKAAEMNALAGSAGGFTVSEQPPCPRCGGALTQVRGKPHCVSCGHKFARNDAGERKGVRPALAEILANLVKAHDVSGEKRDEGGKWTTGGGNIASAEAMATTMVRRSASRTVFHVGQTIRHDDGRVYVITGVNVRRDDQDTFHHTAAVRPATELEAEDSRRSEILASFTRHDDDLLPAEYEERKKLRVELESLNSARTARKLADWRGRVTAAASAISGELSLSPSAAKEAVEYLHNNAESLADRLRGVKEMVGEIRDGLVDPDPDMQFIAEQFPALAAHGRKMRGGE